MTQEELNTLVNEFYEYLAKQKDFYEVWPSEDDTICVDVDWGDWKHDHLRLDHIAREFFENKGYDVLDMDTQVTDEDGSDTYSATHSYRLGKHVEESKVEEKRLKETAMSKGEEIAQLIARAFKGRVGPFGGEDPYLDDNKVTFHSQGPDESWIFNDDGSVDSGDDVDYLVAHNDPSDYGCEDEDELRDYFEEIRHFDSVEDLFNSGLSWFMEVPNEKELLRKINNILNENLKEDVSAKVRLENPKLVSWKEMYLNDVCGGDEEEYNELYADMYEDDEFGDTVCQAFFNVVDDKGNYLGKLGVYKFDMQTWVYEVGFVPNEEYLNKDKLELEDLDLPVDGWFDEEYANKDIRTEQEYKEVAKQFLAKIENALKYSNEDELED